MLVSRRYLTLKSHKRFIDLRCRRQ